MSEIVDGEAAIDTASESAASGAASESAASGSAASDSAAYIWFSPSSEVGSRESSEVARDSVEGVVPTVAQDTSSCEHFTTRLLLRTAAHRHQGRHIDIKVGTQISRYEQYSHNTDTTLTLPIAHQDSLRALWSCQNPASLRYVYKCMMLYIPCAKREISCSKHAPFVA